MKIFLIPLSITFLNPKIILGFLFSTKNSLTQRVKCEKLNLLQKIVGNLFPKIVHEWKGYLEILSCPQIKENSRQYLLLRTNLVPRAFPSKIGWGGKRPHPIFEGKALGTQGRGRVQIFYRKPSLIAPALRQYDNYGIVIKLFYLRQTIHHHNVSLITVLEQ